MNTETPLAGYGTHLRKSRDQLVARVEELEAALKRIEAYPVHSEPVGGAMAMQDIAHETLHHKIR